MKGASLIVILLGATATRARADSATCDQVVDHIEKLMIVASHGGFSDGELDRFRKETVAKCEDAPWSDPRRECYLTATDADAAAACDKDPDLALHVAIPAISQDGTTLALPFAQADGAGVELVALGETDGDDLPLVANQDATAADRETAGYVALPFGKRSAGGITMKVSGAAKKRSVVFKLGKQTVAKTTVKRGGDKTDLEGFAVVRGPRPWIYLELAITKAGEVSTSWVAIPAKLPAEQ